MVNCIKCLFVSTLLFCFAFHAFAQKQKVWVDADSGNETDDIYAIVRILNEPKVEVVGLSSAHFNNADLVAFEKWNQYKTRQINTVLISQQLNEEVLQKTGKWYIPHPLGADKQMGRAWGGREPRDSPAARQIIATISKLPKNEKLAIVCLGALTNIASAISLDTGIAKHLVCYALGAKYNFDKKYWNKSEFNIRNDLNAFDYLLDNPAVDLVIMPINVAAPFQLKRNDLYAILHENSSVQSMLKKRWQETNPQDTVRTLWDLALIEAFLNADFASIKEVSAPPENTERKIKVYAEINQQKMKDDFIAMLKKTDQ